MEGRIKLSFRAKMLKNIFCLSLREKTAIIPNPVVKPSEKLFI